MVTDHFVHLCASQCLTIKSLNSFNVVLSQRVTLSVGVDGVHQGASVRGMGHAQGVAQLVGGYDVQVVG